MATETWLKWLRDVSRDRDAPNGRSPRREIAMALPGITGQDARALATIDSCWDLYARGDDDATYGALVAVRALLPAIQPKNRFLARELIARALDWPDRERLWQVVTKPED